MEDRSILQNIDQLVAEEHQLLEKGDGGTLSTDDHRRLQTVQVMLDQCWDLLRQRRARREFHQDPSQAHVRDSATVEKYQQ
jgi:hypothetical protein